jgi:transcriptional regulator with XRE-family HTH domain
MPAHDVIVRLKSLLAKKNISVIELSQALGKDRNTIHNYLSGKTAMKVADLETIAEYIGEPVAVLFTSEPLNHLSGKEDEVYKQLLNEKDQRIAELKEQLVFLRKFYEKFANRDEDK